MKLFTARCILLLAAMSFVLPLAAQNFLNGTFAVSPANWILGSSGCTLATYSGSIGNPPGSVRLNACGEPTSDPTASQLVPGFAIGYNYVVLVDVRLDANAGGANGQSFAVLISGSSPTTYTTEFLTAGWHRVSVPFVASAYNINFTFAGEHNGADVSYYIDNAEIVKSSVYVNDNMSANTVTGFSETNTALTLQSNISTHGNGLPGVFAANQQVTATYPGMMNCLFASDPNSTPPFFPGGDVAAYTINSNGSLSFTGNATDPLAMNADKGIPLAVDRRNGFPYLFAGFTGEGKIVTFKVLSPSCKLTYGTSTPAVGLTGGRVASLAVSSGGAHVVVVTYQDGSIQSFSVGAGGALTPLAPPFNSTGFTMQGGKPAGVDITANGKYAIFGDDNPLVAEVEVAQISPSGILSPTVDYGGQFMASGVDLRPAINSQNVYISPAQVNPNYSYVYISNNDSMQVTTVKLSITGAVAAIPQTGCASGYFNPVTLTPPTSGAVVFPGGLQTQLTTGAGGYVYVAEQITALASGIAVLRIQAGTGCTREVPGSPFIDVNSTLATGLSVYPHRTF